jgi:hypothetical protein
VEIRGLVYWTEVWNTGKELGNEKTDCIDSHGFRDRGRIGICGAQRSCERGKGHHASVGF